jgi:hypothetical protein
VRALFWSSWAISAVVTAIVVFFFLQGLADGSVSSFNMALWVAILTAVIGATGGSLWLKAAKRPLLATVVAMILGLPGLLAGLFLLVLLVSHPRWN